MRPQNPGIDRVRAAPVDYKERATQEIATRHFLFQNEFTRVTNKLPEKFNNIQEYDPDTYELLNQQLLLATEAEEQVTKSNISRETYELLLDAYVKALNEAKVILQKIERSIDAERDIASWLKKQDQEIQQLKQYLDSLSKDKTMSAHESVKNEKDELSSDVEILKRLVNATKELPREAVAVKAGFRKRQEQIEQLVEQCGNHIAVIEQLRSEVVPPVKKVLGKAELQQELEEHLSDQNEQLASSVPKKPEEKIDFVARLQEGRDVIEGKLNPDEIPGAKIVHPEYGSAFVPPTVMREHVRDTARAERSQKFIEVQAIESRYYEEYRKYAEQVARMGVLRNRLNSTAPKTAELMAVEKELAAADAALVGSHFKRKEVVRDFLHSTATSDEIEKDELIAGKAIQRRLFAGREKKKMEIEHQAWLEYSEGRPAIGYAFKLKNRAAAAAAGFVYGDTLTSNEGRKVQARAKVALAVGALAVVMVVPASMVSVAAVGGWAATVGAGVATRLGAKWGLTKIFLRGKENELAGLQELTAKSVKGATAEDFAQMTTAQEQARRSIDVRRRNIATTSTIAGLAAGAGAASSGFRTGISEAIEQAVSGPRPPAPPTLQYPPDPMSMVPGVDVVPNPTAPPTVLAPAAPEATPLPADPPGPMPGLGEVPAPAAEMDAFSRMNEEEMARRVGASTATPVGEDLGEEPTGEDPRPDGNPPAAVEPRDPARPERLVIPSDVPYTVREGDRLWTVVLREYRALVGPLALEGIPQSRRDDILSELFREVQANPEARQRLGIGPNGNVNQIFTDPARRELNIGSLLQSFDDKVTAYRAENVLPMAPPATPEAPPLVTETPPPERVAVVAKEPRIFSARLTSEEFGSDLAKVADRSGDTQEAQMSFTASDKPRLTSAKLMPSIEDGAGAVKMTVVSNEVPESTAPAAPEIPKAAAPVVPDVLRDIRMTQRGSDLSAPEFARAATELYGSAEAFTAAVEQYVTRINSTGLGFWETVIGNKFDAFSKLSPLSVAEMQRVATLPRPELKATVDAMQIPFKSFVAWRHEIGEMLATLQEVRGAVVDPKITIAQLVNLHVLHQQAVSI